MPHRSTFYKARASSMRHVQPRKKLNYCHFSAPCLILIRVFLPDSYLLGPRPPFPEEKGFSWTVPLNIEFATIINEYIHVVLKSIHELNYSRIFTVFVCVVGGSW